jgi:quercetin dioxygenase-like cupin family protein
MEQSIRIIEKQEGRILGVAGGNYRIIISGEETNNSYAVIEMVVPPGGGPPPHSHPYTQEMFYVLEGEMEFKTEAGRSIVPAGGFINIPFGGAIHCFENTSGSIARLLCTVVPAGLEKIFAAVGLPAAVGEFLPIPELTEERKQLLANLDEIHRQKTYPRDYLDQGKR